MMLDSVVILPTGDEIHEGIVLDTDSPMIMQELLQINSACDIRRARPVRDCQDQIADAIRFYTVNQPDLVVVIGGSGGGHRHSETLGRDYTHSCLETLLDEPVSTSLYGKNGHLWCKLVCGSLDNTLVINVPGPHKEAKLAIHAFLNTYAERAGLPAINGAMAEAVKSAYPI